MVASTSPGWTVSPSRAAIFPSTPLWSAATSTLTFSVSSCTSASPASTGSPSCLSQAPTVASTTDSPSTGTRTSTGMGSDSFERLGNDPLLLSGVRFGPALGWAGTFGSPDVAQHARILPVAFDERPCAHVPRLLLEPDHVARLAVAVEHLGHVLSWERVKLLDAHQRHVVCLPAPLVRFHFSPDVPPA